MAASPYADNIGSDTLRYSDAELYDALTANSWNIARAAVFLAIRRTALKVRIDKSPTLSALLQDRREAAIDSAETNVFNAVDHGDQAASKFVLSTLGAGRGYKAGLSLDSGVEVVIRNITQEVKDAERLQGPERVHGDEQNTSGARGVATVGQEASPDKSGE